MKKKRKNVLLFEEGGLNSVFFLKELLYISENDDIFSITLFVPTKVQFVFMSNSGHHYYSNFDKRWIQVVSKDDVLQVLVDV